MKATVLILLCTFFHVSGMVYGQYSPYDWPMINGNREQTSWAQHERELAPPFESEYYNQFYGGTRISYSDGILLIGDNSWVHAIDLGTETEMWTFQIPNAGGAIGCVPAFAGSLALCGGQGGDGLFALDKETGQQKWFKPIGSLYGRHPIPDDDKIFVVQDSLYCLERETGSTVWSYPISGQLTPTVDDSNVYVLGNAINKSTGEFKWNGGYHGGYFLAVDSQLVYANEGNYTGIVAHEKKDGRNRWRYEIPDGRIIGYYGGSGAISDTYLCFVVWQTLEEKSALYTLDKASGSYVWHHVFDDQGVYKPIIANGIIYLTDWANHDLWGFDVTNGDIVLHDDTDDYWYQPIVADHTLYVLMFWGGVKAFRKAGTGLETLETGNLPQSIRLFQNYPNPFNSTTTIHYTIPSTEPRAKSAGMGLDSDLNAHHTTLKIYNILGREVRTLTEGMKAPGCYTVTWDGRDNRENDVGSGIYIYRLQTNSFQETKEMILLK